MKLPVVFLLLATLACHHLSLPPVVEQVTRIAPRPDVYRTWYAEAERCTGLKGQFSGLQFFAVHAVYFYNPEDSLSQYPLIGLYHWDIIRGRQIYITMKYLLNRAVVVHESIHDLMNLNGLTPGHPDSLFNRPACKLS